MSLDALPGAIQDFAASPHGRQATSSGLTDWVLLALAVLVVAVSLFLALRFFLRPGERDPTHIKRVVLRDTPCPDGASRSSIDPPAPGRAHLFIVPRDPR